MSGLKLLPQDKLSGIERKRERKEEKEEEKRGDCKYWKVANILLIYTFYIVRGRRVVGDTKVRWSTLINIVAEQPCTYSPRPLPAVILREKQT